jgi:hypothetical protein
MMKFLGSYLYSLSMEDMTGNCGVEIRIVPFQLNTECCSQSHCEPDQIGKLAKRTIVSGKMETLRHRRGIK